MSMRIILDDTEITDINTAVLTQQSTFVYHYDDEEKEGKVPGKARREGQAPCKGDRVPSKADCPLPKLDEEQ